MSIEFLPCYHGKDLFMKLAKDYIEELRKFDSSIKWDERTVEDWVWDSNFIVESGKIRGFMFTEFPTICDGKDFLYIAEFYIVPESRMRGLGFSAVEAYTRSWDGNVFLYVLDRNEPAKGFWKTVEQRLGWKRVEEPEIRQENGCELRVFQRLTPHKTTYPTERQCSSRYQRANFE